MMTEKKGGKSRSNTVRSGRKDKGFMNGKRKNFSSRSKNRKVQDSAKRPRRGPRLPNALRKELDVVEPTVDGQYSDGDEDGTDFEDRVVNDVYEYEEGIPEEESKKNRRFDTVENYEYELPEDFEVCPDIVVRNHNHIFDGCYCQVLICYHCFIGLEGCI